MQPSLVVRTLGLLLLLFSASLVPPLLISAWNWDEELPDFLATFALAALGGVALWWPQRKRQHPMRSRDGFIIVALFWAVMSLLSSLPFMIGVEHLSAAEAVFESASGFTTTGATVITGLDSLPGSILIYRQELQWLGGIGVVVSAVAILPMLGIGGMQLYRAETPGPMKDQKLTPRIANTAQRMWVIYLVLTTACAVAYWAAGMSTFDAVAHSLATVSTGGFSTHDASMAYFDSPLIEVIASIFMLLGAVNFSVHFLVVTQRRPELYWRNTEVRVFLLTVAVLTMLVAAMLVVTARHTEPLQALRYASFEVISVITSTGFGVDDFASWPLFLPVLIIFSSFMGGCAGSTAGGMKVVRYVLLVKQGMLEIYRLIHPALIRPIKLDGRVASSRVVNAIWAFVVLYVGVGAVIMLALMATGMDQVTAFGAVAACLNNLGPGLGDVSATFQTATEPALWLLSLTMIMGRLEVFTVIVLLTPAFWRR